MKSEWLAYETKTPSIVRSLVEVLDETTQPPTSSVWSVSPNVSKIHVWSSSVCDVPPASNRVEQQSRATESSNRVEQLLTLAMLHLKELSIEAHHSTTGRTRMRVEYDGAQAHSVGGIRQLFDHLQHSRPEQSRKLACTQCSDCEFGFRQRSSVECMSSW
jgi:hypothetical protein